MRILQISVGESIKGGGVGRIASSLANIFSESGVDSHLASCFSYSLDRKYSFHKLNCFKFPMFSSVVLTRLENMVKQISPDVIFSHAYSSSIPLLSYRVAKKFNIKHAFAVHAFPEDNGIRKLLLSIYKKISYNPLLKSKIIYFSNSAKDKLKLEGKLSMFIPEKSFFIKKKGEDYLLFVGRLDENKRADWFVRICAKLNKKGLIVGNDEGEKRKIQNLIKKLKADVSIKEAEFSEMPSLYSKASALITTSKYEGLPLVWLEAIASEVPILTTKVGDYEEVLKEFYGKQWREFVFENVEEGEKKAKKILGMFKTKKFKDLLRNAKEKLKNRRKVFEKSLLGFIKKLGVRDRNDKV